MPPPEHPLPGPKPKPPKPKPPKPRPEPLRDHAVPEVPFPPDRFACASRCTEPCAHHGLCAPLPPPAATVHLRSSSSSRLPTPLIALSASVLAASAVLLLVLLVCHLLRRRRQRQRQSAAAPLTQHLGNAEAGGGATAPPALSDEDGDDGVRHVWYIRTVGLDERAISAITALVYDSDKCRVGQLLGAGGDDGCAVCLAEFRDGETLRLLPRCGHAFHRGCIDVWLRAHVNCPLCRAPVTVKPAPAPAATLRTTPSSAELGGEAAPAGADPAVAEEEEGNLPEPAAVRRAVSMVALPRRAPWPEVSLLREPASNSGREGGMGGLVKVSEVIKLSEALEMVGVGRSGRSMSFGSARVPARSGQPAATGDVNNADETPR